MRDASAEERMSAMRRIHWKWIIVAGVLAEATVFAFFFLLLFAATAAGVPEIARPLGTLDYINAIVSSFATVLLFTLWVGKRIEVCICPAWRAHRNVRHTAVRYHLARHCRIAGAASPVCRCACAKSNSAALPADAWLRNESDKFLWPRHNFALLVALVTIVGIVGIVCPDSTDLQHGDTK